MTVGVVQLPVLVEEIWLRRWLDVEKWSGMLVSLLSPTKWLFASICRKQENNSKVKTQTSSCLHLACHSANSDGKECLPSIFFLVLTLPDRNKKRQRDENSRTTKGAFYSQLFDDQTNRNVSPSHDAHDVLLTKGQTSPLISQIGNRCCATASAPIGVQKHWCRFKSSVVACDDLQQSSPIKICF